MKGLLRNVVLSGLCAAVLLLWLRSRSRADVLVFFASNGTPQALASSNGRVYFVVSNVPCGDEWTYAVRLASDRSEAWTQILSEADVKRCRGVVGYSSAGVMGMSQAWIRYLALPHWLFAAIAAVSPFLALRYFSAKNRRLRNGLCVQCGYDLRASTTRCPECGRSLAGAESQ